jgi:hypothetical protein
MLRVCASLWHHHYIDEIWWFTICRFLDMRTSSVANPIEVLILHRSYHCHLYFYCWPCPCVCTRCQFLVYIVGNIVVLDDIYTVFID